MRDIFISYRRSSGSEVARALQAKLEHLGYEVFLDIDDLGAGKFDDALISEISRSKAILVILGPGALDRCQDQDDWLRREITAALRGSIIIIPVLLNSFNFPKKEDLPEDIRELVRHQSVRYSHEYFDATVRRITTYLGEPISTLSGSARAPIPSASRIEAAESSERQKSSPHLPPFRQNWRAPEWRLFLAAITLAFVPYWISFTLRAGVLSQDEETQEIYRAPLPKDDTGRVAPVAGAAGPFLAESKALNALSSLMREADAAEIRGWRACLCAATASVSWRLLTGRMPPPGGMVFLLFTFGNIAMMAGPIHWARRSRWGSAIFSTACFSAYAATFFIHGTGLGWDPGIGFQIWRATLLSGGLFFFAHGFAHLAESTPETVRRWRILAVILVSTLIAAWFWYHEGVGEGIEGELEKIRAELRAYKEEKQSTGQ